MRKVGLMAAGVLALGLAGCVTTGVLPQGEQSYIDRVDVVMEKPGGSVNFAEDIRVKLLAEASRYAMTGRRKALKVFVRDLHLKNPAMSLLHGDDNLIVAHVVVLDESGNPQGSFDVRTTDSNTASRLGGVVGAVVAATQNPVDVERRVAGELAADTLERVYGGDRAQAARSRPPVRQVAARYPRSYEELRAEANAAR